MAKRSSSPKVPPPAPPKAAAAGKTMQIGGDLSSKLPHSSMGKITHETGMKHAAEMNGGSDPDNDGDGGDCD